jgi:uncharacterized Zn finger protein
LVQLTQDAIREVCTGAVFERGQSYREEGRIQHLDRFEETVTAAVEGSRLYDVTVDVHGAAIDARCSCPYDGPGECKHVVAVLLDAVADPPADDSDHIDRVLDSVAPDDLRTFVRDALREQPTLRERFLARFGDDDPSVEDYRSEVQQLFDQQMEDSPVVVAAIDFTRLFDLAEQYRDRERYLAAATIYRAVFEGIDDNIQYVDAAYDHYADRFQTALDGYVDCVLEADPDPEVVESHASVLDERVTASPVHREQFERALSTLQNRG